MTKLTENQQKWVDALLSGQYEQGTGFLCVTEADPENDVKAGYCCLGVACQVLFPDEGRDLSMRELKGRAFTVPRKEWFGDTSLAPDEIVDALGLCDSYGSLREPIHSEDGIAYDNLTELNDEAGWSFQQIGEFIRDNPEQVFEQPDECLED